MSFLVIAALISPDIGDVGSQCLSAKSLTSTLPPEAFPHFKVMLSPSGGVLRRVCIKQGHSEGESDL